MQDVIAIFPAKLFVTTRRVWIAVEQTIGDTFCGVVEFGNLESNNTTPDVLDQRALAGSFNHPKSRKFNIIFKSSSQFTHFHPIGAQF
jgi:hypothetical protein